MTQVDVIIMTKIDYHMIFTKTILTYLYQNNNKLNYRIILRLIIKMYEKYFQVRTNHL